MPLGFLSKTKLMQITKKFNVGKTKQSNKGVLAGKSKKPSPPKKSKFKSKAKSKSMSKQQKAGGRKSKNSLSRKLWRIKG